jgi:hypothetical protein
MTPFSLNDLGLSDEEIAALGLGETAAAQPAEEEPAMTPFSLSDLGLSDDESAEFDFGETALAEPAHAEPAAAEPTPAEEEPVMTPFSLSELGLSSEEIAALGLGETPAQPPEPEAEPTAVEADSTRSEVSVAPPPEPPRVTAPPAIPEPARAVAPTTPPPAPEAAPPRRAARPPADDQPPASSGNELLDAYVRRLEGDPHNHGLRLSVARAGGQMGMPDFALQQYRYLLKQNTLLDQIADDIQDLILDADDRQLLKRLHRTLGDVYTKQGRLAEAIDEYGWTPAGS